MFLSIAMGINIVLDLLFVAVFRWGVAGVAFATIIAQWFSWIFGIFYINRMYSEFHLHLRGLHIDRSLLRQIVRIGLPAGIQNGLIAAAIMALMARVNLYGTDFTAGFNVGNKVDCFAFSAGAAWPTPPPPMWGRTWAPGGWTGYAWARGRLWRWGGLVLCHCGGADAAEPAHYAALSRRLPWWTRVCCICGGCCRFMRCLPYSLCSIM